MNNRGQIFFYTLMLSLVLVIIALAMTPTLHSFVQTSMSNNTETNQGLDCGNSTISDFQQAQCKIVDLTTSYWLLGMIAIAGLVIGAKVILGGGVA